MANPKCPICNKSVYCSNPHKFYCGKDMNTHYYHIHPEKGLRLSIFGEIPFTIYNMFNIVNEDPKCYVVIEPSTEKVFSWKELRPFNKEFIDEVKQLVYSTVKGK